MYHEQSYTARGRPGARLIGCTRPDRRRVLLGPDRSTQARPHPGDKCRGAPFVYRTTCIELIECYVLWEVDRLPQGQADALESMAPKLAATYGADGTWQDIVAAQMGFYPGLPEALRGMWDRTLVSAGGGQDAVDPEHWAQQVVDSNFT